MNLMTTVTDVLSSFGASDAALTVMGPTLTIALAWTGGIAIGQGVKFPLSLWLKGDMHGYVVRLVAVFSTFCFSHFLSTHLSVPLEVLVAIVQPLVYLGLKAATEKWIPWASVLFASVSK